VRLAVRLFSALKDLNRLLTAVSKAVVPVCNAFLILLIVAAMYAILGTSFFRTRAPHYFGDFLTSLFTMFQVLSGDSWASAVSRDLFSGDFGGDDTTDPSVVSPLHPRADLPSPAHYLSRASMPRCLYCLPCLSVRMRATPFERTCLHMLSSDADMCAAAVDANTRCACEQLCMPADMLTCVLVDAHRRFSSSATSLSIRLCCSTSWLQW
jgi:hypothetical protein